MRILRLQRVLRIFVYYCLLFKFSLFYRDSYKIFVEKYNFEISTKMDTNM